MDLRQEKELIEQIKTNPSLFGQIFDYYYPPIFGYILKRVANSAITQDIASETFFKALKSINKFRWQDISIRSWLYKIATNEIRIYFRSNKYEKTSLDQLLISEGYQLEDPQNLVEEIIEAQRVLERHQDFLNVQKELMKLPIEYQEVIILRFSEQRKISEISSILGKKEGTVKSLLSRGLEKLRQNLNSIEVQPFQDKSIIDNRGQQVTPNIYKLYGK